MPHSKNQRFTESAIAMLRKCETPMSEWTITVLACGLDRATRAAGRMGGRGAVAGRSRHDMVDSLAKKWDPEMDPL